MDPLRRVFPRLPQEAVNFISETLRNKENPISCDCCKNYIFSNELDCWEGRCPFIKRRVRDLLIESHIPLVKRIVNTVTAPKDYYECISVGLLALTEAINKIPDLRPNSNIGAYVRIFVTKELKQFILTNTVIKVPAYAHPSYNFLRKTHLVRSNSDFAQVPGQQTQVDLDESLSKIVGTMYEQIILKCIIGKGYSGKDMAEMCKITTQRVSQIKNKLEDKILEILK